MMYEVVVSRTVTVEQTVTVWAKSDEDAAEKAIEKAMQEIEWDMNSAEADYDVGSMELVTGDEDAEIEAYERRMERDADSDDVRNREFGGMDW